MPASSQMGGGLGFGMARKAPWHKSRKPASPRNAEGRSKPAQKAMIAADAGDAVTQWRDHLRDIEARHVIPGDDVNWQMLKDTREPAPPRKRSTNETAAIAALAQFQPRFFDFLSGGSHKKRQLLTDAVAEAKQQDETEHQKTLAQFEQEHADWQTDKDLAARILARRDRGRA